MDNHRSPIFDRIRIRNQLAKKGKVSHISQPAPPITNYLIEIRGNYNKVGKVEVH